MPGPPFSCTLTAPATYTLGDAVLVTCRITNETARSYRVLTWGTPLEGEVTHYLEVRRDGEKVEYDGRLIMRGEPGADSYLTLGPGEQVTRVLDVSASYAIDRPGAYTVTLAGRFHDAFAVPDETEELSARPFAAHEPLALPGATAAFVVLPGPGPARLTSGEAARRAEREKAAPAAGEAEPRALREPVFVNMDAAQQAEMRLAQENAVYYAGLAVNKLLVTTATDNFSYVRWFGAWDQGRYDTVRRHYQDVGTALRDDVWTYDGAGASCASNTIAYTHKNSRTVYFCPLFWPLSAMGATSKATVLLHECTHAVSGTNDYAYGQSVCLALAKSDPAKAVENADSYLFFASENAESGFGKTVSFITDRSTFGADEITAMLAQGSPAVIDRAFYVIADGYWPEKLVISADDLTGPPRSKPFFENFPDVPGMTITVTGLETEDGTLVSRPQRFTWVYRIAFADIGGFPTLPGDGRTVTLSATVSGLRSSALIGLVHEPNPYEIDGSRYWLSHDLRVFQIRAGETRFGATMGQTAADAPAYIAQVIGNLNTGNSGGQSFDTLPLAEQTSQLELSQQVGGANVFDFAVLRVRYRGTTGVPGVRAFFRLFPVNTTSTDFAPDTSYRRFTAGTTAVPLLGLGPGGDVISVPCFAAPRVDSAAQPLTAQRDEPNVQTLTPGTGGDEGYAHFGCWLDINQTQPQFPAHPSPPDGPWPAGRQTVQQLIRNAHQCLVAEIAFDPDPIPAGANPASSDKLAQRNLAVVTSANPGDPDSHRIVNTFEIRPPAPPDGEEGEDQQPPAAPGELILELTGLPPGTTATVYVPDFDMAGVLAVADRRYVHHGLEKVDAHTLRLPAGGIAYLPLPEDFDAPAAGLLVVDLPPTVHKGEVYEVVVRQTTGVQAAPPQLTETEDAGVYTWQQVLGSYQLTVPVLHEEEILPYETRLLAVLKWILISLPVGDRWYGVFFRYVAHVAARVRALGGDPDQVRPSPSGGDPGCSPCHCCRCHP